MTESKTQTGLSCLTKIVIAMILLPLLLVLAIVVWWFSRQSIAKGQLNQKLAELRTDGLPVDVVSLQDFYERQTDDFQVNRWIGLLDRVESPQFRSPAISMPILGKGQDVPTNPDFAWPEEEPVRKFLSDQGPIFTELADLGENVAPVRYPVRFDNQPVPIRVTETRTLSRLLALRHQVAVRDQDKPTATDSILSMIAVARSMEGQVTLINQAMRIANMEHAIGELQMGLTAKAYDAVGLERIATALGRRGDASKQLQIAIQGERAFMLNAYQSLQGTIPASPVTGPTAMLYTIDVYSQFSDAITPDVVQAVKDIQMIGDKVQQQRQSAGFVAQMDSALTPQLGQVFGTFSRCERNCRSAETAIQDQLALPRSTENP